MTDLETFAKCMDGQWEVIAIEKIDGRTKVTYRSMDNPRVIWSHMPYHPEMVAYEVGHVGRIGFITTI